MDQVLFPDAIPRDQTLEDTTRDERSFRGTVGSPLLISQLCVASIMCTTHQSSSIGPLLCLYRECLLKSTICEHADHCCVVGGVIFDSLHHPVVAKMHAAPVAKWRVYCVYLCIFVWFSLSRIRKKFKFVMKTRVFPKLTAPPKPTKLKSSESTDGPSHEKSEIKSIPQKLASVDQKYVCCLHAWLIPAALADTWSPGWCLQPWLVPAALVGASSPGWCLQPWLVPGALAGTWSPGWCLQP